MKLFSPGLHLISCIRFQGGYITHFTHIGLHLPPPPPLVIHPPFLLISPQTFFNLSKRNFMKYFRHLISESRPIKSLSFDKNWIFRFEFIKNKTCSQSHFLGLYQISKLLIYQISKLLICIKNNVQNSNKVRYKCTLSVR